MKKIFILVGVLTFIVGCNQPNIDQEKSNAEAAIKGFYSAAEKFDYATMRTFCTPNFHAIEDGHTYNNLDEFLEMMKTMENFTGQIKLDIIKTDIGKDMALSIVKFDAQFKNEETQMFFKTIENYSLKKVDGKWLIDFFQSTFLSDSKKLEKGNLVGVHVVTVELNQGVTMEQFKDFYINKYLPEINKFDPAWQAFVVDGIRGEHANQLGMIYVISSTKDRDKYYNHDGTSTQLGIDALKKMQPVNDKLNQLGSVSTKYTDWVVE